MLPGTWDFKLKWMPYGDPLNFKALYCVGADKKSEGVDYFETYSTVISWSTLRLALTLILSNGCHTKQVDCTNDFYQVDLKETFFIEAPRGHHFKEGKEKVMKLIKGLYWIKQAPRIFFEKLRDGLLKQGFVQSEMDK